MSFESVNVRGCSNVAVCESELEGRGEDIGKNRCFIKEGQSSRGIFHVGTAARREQVSNRLRYKATEWL